MKEEGGRGRDRKSLCDERNITTVGKDQNTQTAHNYICASHWQREAHVHFLSLYLVLEQEASTLLPLHWETLWHTFTAMFYSMQMRERKILVCVCVSVCMCWDFLMHVDREVSLASLQVVRTIDGLQTSLSSSFMTLWHPGRVNLTQWRTRPSLKLLGLLIWWKLTGTPEPQGVYRHTDHVVNVVRRSNSLLFIFASTYSISHIQTYSGTRGYTICGLSLSR